MRADNVSGATLRSHTKRMAASLLPALCLLGLIVIFMPAFNGQVAAQAQRAPPLLIGALHDRQGVPVERAEVTLHAGPEGAVLAVAESQPDGRYALVLPEITSIPGDLFVQVRRAHFQESTQALGEEVAAALALDQTVVLPDLEMTRSISPAFWVSTIVFAGMLLVIAATELHNTLAALFGAVLILGISYLVSPFLQGFFIFDFDTALSYVDWNVIFLVMGMMIVIAVVERTGVFQWLALWAYRLSGGRPWLLLAVLMLITGLASAFLDNVTTMLLMTPISVQIALALGLNPLALLIPEVMASNVIGVSTLVGTPTNILIGSYADISFNDFLVNLTPGVVLSFSGLLLYCLIVYRKELRAGGEMSPHLLARLTERAQIDQPANLRKVLWVGGGMLLLFVFGERIHLAPAVTALMGATALLYWTKPDVEEMIDAVDWTTLVFFIALFIVVGAIQEVGFISLIAEGIGRLVGDSLFLAMMAIIWLGALLSTVVANIPFTAAMLPVVGFLSATVPGAQNKALFYSLSVGSAMGGNGSLIGASANLVTAGIAARVGYPITYGYFLLKGLPALFITVALSTVWLLFRFLF